MYSVQAYIVDADQRARLRLRELLEAEGVSCRPFVAGSDLIEELPHLSAGIVLVDIQNAGENGFDVIEAVSRIKLACPIIGMTELGDVNIAVACIRRGAVDFLVKPIDPEELTSAFAGACAILAQRKLVFEQTEADERLLRRLTPRETSVLELIADGQGNKFIASMLAISVRTVEAYRATIVDKLKVLNSTAAAAMLVRHRTAVQAHAARVVTAAAARS